MDEIDEVMRVTGKVKWFNQYKGYGFVEVNGIEEDVFLHFSSIKRSEIGNVSNNDIILCEIAKSEKGYQVTRVVQLLQANKYETSDEEKEILATMKWFNPSKGFGFAQLSTGEDVFIHANLLKKYKIDTIEHDEKIKLIVRHTNFGYEAVDLVM
jgi:CspA family cold shock protein